MIQRNEPEATVASDPEGDYSNFYVFVRPSEVKACTPSVLQSVMTQTTSDNRETAIQAET